ncbi:acyltransferase family protein [Flavobacterium sp.]|jgi:peptidoglycan/LPS O-acetylase OafA/YrhL|uniref:acyltransferase family protein n=1 Tax=Flavobacterium sp. TaxID=239 RepID=UPI0037C0869B
MIQNTNRLRELDFLRGVAIILVLLRHLPLTPFTSKMGWIGVDLFFVLSGFLVSGLLFKEYNKFGNIKPKLFLIRRGFKIYPIYFLTYFLYLSIKLVKGQFLWKGLLADVFFIQNYIMGWGYAYVATWSLAIEEHFYFFFAILLYFAIKKSFFNLKFNSKWSYFEIVILLLLIIIFILRLYSNYYHPELKEKNVTMTHLRMDSLLFGVLISYFYYFKNQILTNFFNNNKRLLIIIAVILLMFTPFIDFEDSIFVRTFGFTFLYISFGIFLISFLVYQNINSVLNKMFSERVVNFISRIGLASYSIYLIHGFVAVSFSFLRSYVFKIQVDPIVLFPFTATTSIVLGMIMTNYIEKYFLTIRDKFYPSRIA